MNPDRLNLTEYLPIGFSLRDGEPVVQWFYVGTGRLTEPFFDHSIERRSHLPFNLFFQPRTSVEGLADLARGQRATDPTGFIFHLSRCGSTLITQMLAALPQNVVLSEPSPVDAVLRIRNRYPEVTEEQQIQWLRWMIGALGHPRRPCERQVFVKFDSWHAVYLPLLRRAFPKVPFLFLYRDPVEVMVSQMDRRGGRMLPGIFQRDGYGIPAEAARLMTEVEYCARVLAIICQTALNHHRDHPLRLLNYRQLPAVVWEDMAIDFKLEYTPAEVDRMQCAARFDAKQPSLEFAADSKRKRGAATSEVLQVCVDVLDPLYRQLESARLGVAGRVQGS